MRTVQLDENLTSASITDYSPTATAHDPLTFFTLRVSVRVMTTVVAIFFFVMCPLAIHRLARVFHVLSFLSFYMIKSF